MNDWKDDIPPPSNRGRAWLSEPAKKSLVKINFAHRVLRQRLNHQYHSVDVFVDWDDKKVRKIIEKYWPVQSYTKRDKFFELKPLITDVYRFEGGFQLKPWLRPEFYVVNDIVSKVVVPSFEGALLKFLGYDVATSTSPPGADISFAGFQDYDELEVLIENTIYIWKDFWVVFLESRKIPLPPELKDHWHNFR